MGFVTRLLREAERGRRLWEDDGEKDGDESDDADENEDDDDAMVEKNSGRGVSGMTGIDIGTGASAIYPLLLLLRLHPSWRMLATELDDTNLKYARENVRRNGLEGRCKVVQAQTSPSASASSATPTPASGKATNNNTATSNISSASGTASSGPAVQPPPLLPLQAMQQLGITEVDFLMTNPPFYASPTEMLASAAAKHRPPNSACTGAEVEMCCEGGEVGFVGRLVEESKTLHEDEGKKKEGRGGVVVKVRWWTAMLGKLSSVGEVVERLRGVGCGNYVVGELGMGGRTKRWVVGWSFGGERVGGGGGGGEGKVVESASGVERRWLPPANVVGWGVEGTKGVVGAKVDEIVEELDFEEGEGDGEGGERREGVRWRWSVGRCRGVGVAWKGDCWSRKARRRREMLLREGGRDAEMMNGGDGEGEQSEAAEPKLVFRIKVVEADEPGMATVEVRWLFGYDAVIYESFVGWLKRKLKES